MPLAELSNVAMGVLVVVIVSVIVVVGAVSSTTPVSVEVTPTGVKWRMFALNGFTRIGEIDLRSKRLRLTRKIFGFIPVGTVDEPLSGFGAVSMRTEPWGDLNTAYRVEVRRKGGYELVLMAFPAADTSSAGAEICLKLRDAVENAIAQGTGMTAAPKAAPRPAGAGGMTCPNCKKSFPMSATTCASCKVALFQA